MEKTFSESVLLPQRKLIVSKEDINLPNIGSEGYENHIFILFVQESKGSAGGRGGGSGMRKISSIIGYRITQKGEDLIYDTSEESNIQKFEIPYSAVAMDIILKKGEIVVVQGIVDPDLIRDYLEIMKHEK